MFKYIKCKEGYFIVLKIIDYYYHDKPIANKIGITLEDYQQILINFGAQLNKNELFFLTKQQTNQAINYLNEKYALIFKLID